jgi:hypothetical protein
MKKQNFTKLTTIFLLTICIWACSKEYPTSDNQTRRNYNVDVDPLNSNLFQKENDYLKFNSHDDFKSVYDGFQQVAKDKKYLAENKIEPDNSTESSEDHYFTRYPLGEAFDKKIGFESALLDEEKSLFSFLKSGGEPKDFDDLFIDDNTLKSLLNKHLEIKIGKFMFKFIDSLNVVRITDGTYDDLLSLRGKKVSQIEVSDKIFI